MEPYLRGADSIVNSFEQKLSSKSLALKVDEPEASQVGEGFECNICFDLVQDPVVTFCGHLYCWACIYKWIISFPNDPDEQNPRCPVCKTEVSEKTMIPLYGRGQPTHPSKQDAHRIPERPSTLVSITDRSSSPFNHLPHRSFSIPEEQQPYLTTGNHIASAPVIDPMIGVFGEMVYARIFGNSGTTFEYPTSYRYTVTQRQQYRMTQMNRSLSRVCFFLCCCTVMCLFLF